MEMGHYSSVYISTRESVCTFQVRKTRVDGWMEEPGHGGEVDNEDERRRLCFDLVMKD